MHVKRLCAADKNQSPFPNNDPQMMDAENRGIYPSFQFPQQPVVMMPGHQVGDKQEVETQGGNGRKWESERGIYHFKNVAFVCKMI